MVPSGRFDGDELFSRPDVTLIAVDAELIHQAEKLIESCEHCPPDVAKFRLIGWVLRFPIYSFYSNRSDNQKEENRENPNGDFPRCICVGNRTVRVPGAGQFHHRDQTEFPPAAAYTVSKN